MLGTFLRLYWLYILTRDAARLASGLPTKSTRGWWLRFGGYCLAGGTMMALGVALHDPNAKSAVVRDGFIIGALMMVMMVLPCSGVAWLVGRRKRPETVLPTALYYLHSEESTRGPFPLSHIADLVKNRDWRAAGVQLCAVDTSNWYPASEVLGRMAKPRKGGSFWTGWIKQIKCSFQPNETMNYRIFIPSLFGALLLGMLLHWGFAERYRFQAIGSGRMIKTDRWSGQAWMGGYGDTWVPIKETK